MIHNNGDYVFEGFLILLSPIWIWFWLLGKAYEKIFKKTLID